MNWIFPALAIVAIIHVTAIVLGRPLGTQVRRIAFGSGILGLLSISLMISLEIMSFCIGGDCRKGVGVADIADVVVAILALSSLTSLMVIGFHRTRA
jgi:hypothetical protein